MIPAFRLSRGRAALGWASRTARPPPGDDPTMIRLSRAGLAAAAALALLAGPAAAQKHKTLGTVQRLDKGLDAVLAPDAAVEVLAESKFEWVAGPIWDRARHSR